MPVPKGVNKKKHSDCEQKVMAQGKDKVAAIRICNDSLTGKTQRKKYNK